MANDKDFKIKNNLDVGGGKVYLSTAPATTTSELSALVLDGTEVKTRELSGGAFLADTSIVQTTGNQTIAGVKTFSNSTSFTGRINGTAPSLASATQNAGNSGTVVNNTILNSSVENGSLSMLNTINELAGFDKWGTIQNVSNFYSTRTGSPGSYSYSTAIAADNAGWEKAFDGTSGTAGSWFMDDGASGTDFTSNKATFELHFNSVKSLAYTCYAGIVFGSGSFVPSQLKIEAYTGGAYHTLCDLTNNTEVVVARRVNNTGSNGLERLRFTMNGNPTSGNGYIRIQEIFAVDHDAGNNSTRHKGRYFMSKYMDDYHFGDLFPGTDSTYDLGSSSYAYAETHTDKIFLHGPAATTTGTSALILDGTEVKTRTLGASAFKTYGIADDNAVEIDDTDAASGNYARFTANGIEGRTAANVLSDIGAQASLTFGIANDNAVEIDDADAESGDYAKFTSNGLEGRSASEVKTDLSLNNVENTALSTGTALNATNVTVTANNTTDETNYLTFGAGGANSGNIGLETDTALSYNPNSNRLVTGRLSAGASAGTTTADIEISQNSGATLLFHSTDTTIEANQEIGKIHFKSSDTTDTDGQEVQAQIKVIASSTAGGGVIVFETQDVTQGDDNDDLVERLRITEDGQVGIGTNDPLTALHVSSSGNTIARITSANGSDAILDLGDVADSDGGRIAYDSSNNLVFNTVSTERLRINSSGKVGIGTVGADPDNFLHVKSSDEVLAKFQSTDATAQIICVDNNGSAGIGAVGDTLHLNPAGTSKATLNTSGLFTATRATFSDSTTNGPRLILELSDSNPSDNDIIAGLDFRAKNSEGSGALQYASIEGQIVDETAGEIDGQLLFRVTKANSTLHTGLTLGGDLANFGTSTVKAGELDLHDTTAGSSSTSGPILRLHRDTAPDPSDLLGRIVFEGDNAAGEVVEYGFIQAEIVGASTADDDGTESGTLKLGAIRSGTTETYLSLTGTQVTLPEKAIQFEPSLSSRSSAGFTFEMVNIDSAQSMLRVNNNCHLAAYGLRVYASGSGNTASSATTLVGKSATGIPFANLDQIKGHGSSNYRLDLRTTSGVQNTFPRGITFGYTSSVIPVVRPQTNGVGTLGASIAYWDSTYTEKLFIKEYITLQDSDYIAFGTSFDAKFFYDGSNNDFELELESACGDFLITDNGTTRFTFNKSSGNFTATGNVTAFSDARLKTDVKTLDPSKTLQMRGVEFIKDGQKGSGVIAQELEKVAPELVSEGKEGYKSVAYGNLTGYLIETVKEQQKQIDELKELVQKLLDK